mgnify:CR=1 FL=1
MKIKMKTINDLFDYFDTLVSDDNDDLMFASSYIRGFVTLVAGKYGDFEQRFSRELAGDIFLQMRSARSELSPADQTLVFEFWQELSSEFVE